MVSPNIETFREVVPYVYSWKTPTIPKYDGWEKIGYTEQRLLGRAHRAAG